MSSALTMASGEPQRTSGRPVPPIGAVIGSMLGVAVWLVFILVYALLWSKGYDLFQNLVVAFVSLAVTAIAIGAMWAVWGYRRYGSFDWRD